MKAYFYTEKFLPIETLPCESIVMRTYDLNHGQW